MTAVHDTVGVAGNGGDFAAFAEAYRDAASDWDVEQALPRQVRQAMSEAGHLGATVPTEYGGAGLPLRRFGELCLELGSVCTSMRSLVTVQNLVADTIRRWGTTAQRDRWLPALASGELVAGLAATEPSAGSDLAITRTTVRPDRDGYRVSGEKSWITFGELADVYLVLGWADGKPVTVLVERPDPGVVVHPIRDQLGLRAAMLAHVEFEDVAIPADRLVGKAGFGLSPILYGALDHGRFSVAWGCAGMVRTCLRMSARHATGRVQGSTTLADHQLIRRLVTDMAVDAASTRLLCTEAAELVSAGAPDSSTAILTAKYAAARAAAAAASAAVQVHGSAGCSSHHPAQRFYRDAKLMQLIEGSDEIGQIKICEAAFRKHGRPDPGATR